VREPRFEAAEAQGGILVARSCCLAEPMAVSREIITIEGVHRQMLRTVWVA
jgi:hypothetical protein